MIKLQVTLKHYLGHSGIVILGDKAVLYDLELKVKELVYAYAQERNLEVV